VTLTCTVLFVGIGEGHRPAVVGRQPGNAERHVGGNPPSKIVAEPPFTSHARMFAELSAQASPQAPMAPEK